MVTLGIIILLLLALCASPVAAHATLDESTPANGAQVEEAPDEIMLQFSGDGIEIADVEIVDADGERVDTGEAEIDAENNQIVRVPLGDAGEGTYTVTWEVLATDGHTTTGSFFFIIGEEDLDREQILDLHTEDEDADEDKISPIEAISKGLLLASLILLVGVPVTMISAVYPAARRFDVLIDVGDRLANHLLLGVGVVALLSATLLGLVRLLSSYPELSLDTVTQFLGVNTGQAWLAQMLVAVALITVIDLGRQDRLSPTHWLGGALVGGLSIQILIGWTSHSASMIDELIGMLVDVLHLVGGAFWVGGLLVLAFIVPRILPDDDGNPAQVATVIIRRFSIVAIIGVTLVVAAGLLLTAWHVPSLAAVGETLYGSALGIKVALVVGAFGLSGFARTVLLRRLQTRPERQATVRTFTRSVRLEVAVLVIVVLISGLITSAPTAAVAGEQDAPEPVVLHSEAEDIEIELRVTPGEVGPNVFDVTFTRDSEPVEPDEEVTMLMRNEQDDVTLPQTELEHVGNNTYSTVEAIATEATWTVRITTWIDDTRISEWVDLQITPADEDGSGHENDHDEQESTTSDEMFTRLLQAGAILAGILGTVAVVYETVAFKREFGEKN